MENNHPDQHANSLKERFKHKNEKAVEPNNPKAENLEPDPIDERDLPPFQVGKPTI